MKKFLSWLHDWDWRPLVRLIAWVFIAAHFECVTKAGLAHLGRELVLSWLLSFGILTHLQLILLMIGVRFYLALDEATYRLAERIVQPFLDDKPFALRFLTAFAGQVAIAFGTVGAWRAWHSGARLIALANLAWRSTCG